MSHPLEVLALSLLGGLAIPAGGLLAKVEHIQPLWLERELRHTVIAFASVPPRPSVPRSGSIEICTANRQG